MFNYKLNNTSRLNYLINKASLALIAFVLLITLCCGKRTPPAAPVERVSQRATISGYQQGSRIVLNWTMPARNSSDNSTTFINRVDVYRLVEPLNTTNQITEEEFSSKSTLIDSVIIKPDDFSLNTLTYSDLLEFSSQNSRLRYAIRFVNQSGQKASFSNFLTIEPSPKISGKPENLSTQLRQDAIEIKWSKPQTNVDGSTPVNILGFNVYRKDEASSSVKKINTSPITETTFADNFFEFENAYTYFVRAVSIGLNGQPVESESSQEIKILPKDTFPPKTPEGITIAASPNNISLFFAANSEKDIAGYKIFRSTDQSKSLDQWETLTETVITTNTFQDKTVNSGTKYFYFIIAIDKFGNSSEPSQIVGETAF